MRAPYDCAILCALCVKLTEMIDEGDTVSFVSHALLLEMDLTVGSSVLNSVLSSIVSSSIWFSLLSVSTRSYNRSYLVDLMEQF